MQHGVKKISLSQEARRLKHEKDQQKIETYKHLIKRLLSQKHAAVYTEDTLKLTTDILKLNPELYVAWNYRKEILMALIPDVLPRKNTLEEELNLVMFHLKRFPKCYWVWNHRMWSLNQLDQYQLANWSKELGLVSKVLEADARNFHGWQYRRWVVGERDKNASAPELLESLIEEYKYTTLKINSNISNFSAWHQRSKLIPRLFEALRNEGDLKKQRDPELICFETPFAILCHELELVKTGMYMDVDDSSVWLYLEWLFTSDFFSHIEDKEAYYSILEKQLQMVEELNELEKDDDMYGRDNVWCLKSMVFLRKRICTIRKETNSNERQTDEHIPKLINKLIERDPLRKGRYIDQLNQLTA